MYTQPTHLQVLLVEDDEDDYLFIRHLLSGLYALGVTLNWMTEFDAALNAILDGKFDICLLDYRLGARTGLEFLEQAMQRGCRTPVIFLTGQGNRAVDIEAMRIGAADYLPKDGIDAALLERSIRYAIERARARDLLQKSHDELEARVLERTEELSRVNEALSLNMERLRLAHDAAKAGAWEWDLETNKYFWSDELFNLYGLAPHSCEPSYDAWFNSIHPDDREKIRLVTEEAVRKGSPLSVEWRVNHGGDSPCWLMSRGRAVRDACGRPVRYRGIVMDITERKLLEGALRESEEQFRRLFDQSPIGATIVSLDYRILRANEKFCNLVGYTEQELLSMRFTDLTHPEDIENNCREVEKVVFGELEQACIEKRYINRNGNNVWARVSLRLIRDCNGKPLHLFPLIEDIELIKQTNELLRLQMDLSNSLGSIENLKDAIDSLLDHVISIKEFDAGWCYIIDNDINDIRLGSWKYLSDEFMQKVYCHHQDLCHANSGMFDDSVDISNPAKAFHVFNDIPNKLLKHEGIKSIAVINIKHERRVVAALNLASRTHETISPDTHCALGAIGSQVGGAIARFQMSEALRESERKYRNLIENLQEGIWVIDNNGITTFINDPIIEMLGLESEKITGEDIFSFVNGDGIENLRSYLERRKYGAKEKMDIAFVHHNGTAVYTSVNSSPIFDAKGYSGAIIGITDITSRVLSEIALNNVMNDLESLVNERTAELEEMNSTLRVLLKRRDDDKNELDENMVFNFKQAVIPYIDILKTTHLSDRQKAFLEILESNVKEITSPFMRNLFTMLPGLTPMEVRVASLVQEGKSTKEVADLLGVTEDTIRFHRLNLRKKSGLKESKGNLKTYLQSLKKI